MSKRRFVEALGGKILVEGRAGDVSRVSTDTRVIKKGDVFIGLKGPNFDGSKFAAQAVNSGAALVTVERATSQTKKLAASKSVWLVQVKDCRKALWSAAVDQRWMFQGRVIAITGSNGKTGTKTLLSALMGKSCHSTPGNFNNEIGLPLTLLGLREVHRDLVLEMGMNSSGEIAALTRLARPDVGLVLNVGDAHSGRLGGRAGVEKAKGELIDNIGRSGIAILNADDAATLRMAGRHQGRSLLFGSSSRADVRATRVRDKGAQGLRAALKWPGGKGQLQIKSGGRPGFEQALAAFSVGLATGLKPAAMLVDLKHYESDTHMRLEMKSMKGIHAVLDSYNASPQSMEAALDWVALSSPRGRRVAVLGDMLELGEESEKFHRMVGRVARQKGFRRLAALGKYGKAVAEGFGKGSAVFPEGGWLKAAEWVAGEIKPADWVLFKGSRAMAMEKVYDNLRQQMGILN